MNRSSILGCFALISALLGALILGSCAALLPSAKETVAPTWANFDESKAAFDLVVPYKTSIDELKSIGYNPFDKADIHILTYLDIVQRFMPTPSIKIEDLDQGIQSCIRKTVDCTAYEQRSLVLKNKRYGSVFLDLFNFKRQTHTTGWEFNALFVIVDDTVVFKLWSGSPTIEEDRMTKNPLGPLQNADTLLFNRGL